MTRNEEVELKLELEPADVERFHALPAVGKPTRRAMLQVTTYFDTPSGELRKAGYSLRLRRKGRRCVQTVKHRGADSGGFSARAEWEKKIEGPNLDFSALDGTPLAKILGKKKIRARLVPVSETRVRRTLWNLKAGASAIELILDEGEVASGPRQEPICEIELELKRGSREALFDIARTIGREVRLRMGVMSKSERGYMLAEPGRRRIRKAEHVELTPEMSVAEAFAAIVQSCLRHFRLNEPLVLERKAEGLHQARVGIRRLRSAISLFKPALADPAVDPLREELRWFAGVLGNARNLDVVLSTRRSAEFGPPLSAAERRRLKAERKQAYVEVVDALQSTRLTALLLEIVAWAETGAWRQSELAQRPIIGFSDERLGRQWRKVRKAGKDIAALEPEARHDLRIDAKKLRYAAEFFSSLASRGKRRQQKAFLAALKELQEGLGELNDIETAKLVAPTLAAQADPAELLRISQRAFDRLADIGPYWR